MKGEPKNPNSPNVKKELKQIEEREKVQLPKTVDECEQATENSFIDASIALTFIEDIHGEMYEEFIESSESLETAFFHTNNGALAKHLLVLINTPDETFDRKEAEELIASTTSLALRIGASIHALVNAGFGKTREDVITKLSAGQTDTTTEDYAAVTHQRTTLIGLLRTLSNRIDNPTWSLETTLELPAIAVLLNPLDSSPTVIDAWKKRKSAAIDVGSTDAHDSIPDLSKIVTERLKYDLELIATRSPNPEMQDAADTLTDYLSTKGIAYRNATIEEFTNVHLSQESPETFIAVFNALNTIKAQDPELFFELLGIDVSRSATQTTSKFFGSYLHIALANTQKRLQENTNKSLAIAHLLNATLDLHAVPKQFAGATTRATLHAMSEKIQSNVTSAESTTSKTTTLLSNLLPYTTLAMDNEIREQLDHLKSHDFLFLRSEYDRLEHSNSPVKFLQFLSTLPDAAVEDEGLLERLCRTFPGIVNGAGYFYPTINLPKELWRFNIFKKDCQEIHYMLARCLYQKIPVYKIRGDSLLQLTNADGTGTVFTDKLVIYPRAEILEQDLKALVGNFGNSNNWNGLIDGALKTPDNVNVYPQEIVRKAITGSRPLVIRKSERKAIEKRIDGYAQWYDGTTGYSTTITMLIEKEKYEQEDFMIIARLTEHYVSSAISRRGKFYENFIEVLQALKEKGDPIELLNLLVAQEKSDIIFALFPLLDAIIPTVALENWLNQDSMIVRNFAQNAFNPWKIISVEKRFVKNSLNIVASSKAHLQALQRAWDNKPSTVSRLDLLRQAREAMDYHYFGMLEREKTSRYRSFVLERGDQDHRQYLDVIGVFADAGCSIQTILAAKKEMNSDILKSYGPLSEWGNLLTEKKETKNARFAFTNLQSFITSLFFQSADLEKDHPNQHHLQTNIENSLKAMSMLEDRI